MATLDTTRMFLPENSAKVLYFLCLTKAECRLSWAIAFGMGVFVPVSTAGAVPAT